MFSKKFLFSKISVLSFLIAFAGNAKAVNENENPTLSFKKMKAFPGFEKGYSQGVSACYAGKIGEKLIMAGGCNFPDVPAVDGGKKRYYKEIYAADFTSESVFKWKQVGNLPAASAYGTTVTYGNQLIFIGGMNDNGSHTMVISVSLDNNKQIVVKNLPALPAPMDNMAGSIIGKTIYVAGGKVNGKPSNKMFYMNIDNPEQGWLESVAFPGNPRVQPVMAAVSDNIYLMGGFSGAFDGNKPTISTDGYKFSTKTNQWSKLSSPLNQKGKKVSLGGGVAVAVNDSLILCSGGVNKDVFLKALQNEAGLKSDKAKKNSTEYLSHPVEWYQFNKNIFLYNTIRNKWYLVGENQLMARAGAAIVGDGSKFFMINGELKPGIRTPEITQIRLNCKGDFASFVNPFIGTGGHGHTFPGPTVPFGMIQPGPDTRINGWDACSGYYYADSTINGFSHTHLSGTGCGDYGDFLIMPVTGEVKYAGTTASDQILPYASVFSHANETATPGYYSVFLDTYQVQAELTSTKRSAIHRYTFPASKKSGFIFDVDYTLQGQRNNKMQLEVEGNNVLKGFKNTSGWAWDHQLCFYAVFSKPFKYTPINDTVINNLTKQKSVLKKALLQFETVENEQVMVKIAISPVDVEGAKRNLLAEIPDWDFDTAAKNARNEWNNYLKKIEITTPDEDHKTIFYTALYHTGIAPNLFSDVDGRYRGMNKKILQTPLNKPVYTVFSLWDTMRAFHPLLTIINPELNSDFISSLLKKYKEGGILPMWELAANYTGTMIGYNAVPVIVDAYIKGDRSFDAAEALKACLKSAEYDTTGILSTRWVRDNGLMPLSKYYKNTIGYVPCDKENENVAKGLEYAYDDWCIARLAENLNDTVTQNRYDKLAKNYMHYFDPAVRFMRGKDSEGKWRVPFSPNTSTHREDDYCEGTSWQWTWFVPHDVEGLKKLMGGEKAFVSKLDSLFLDNTPMQGDKISADISGLIGQYAHGNEPSHHIIHLYNYANQPWKTQLLIDSVLYNQYRNTPDGLSGNEDCGQMSAWYILNALGFYQVCPGKPEWSIGRPLFDKAVIHLPNNKNFVIDAQNQSRKNKYVQKTTLNGRKLLKPFLNHADIMNGGTLQFKMSENVKTK